MHPFNRTLASIPSMTKCAGCMLADVAGKHSLRVSICRSAFPRLPLLRYSDCRRTLAQRHSVVVRAATDVWQAEAVHEMRSC